MIYPLHSPTIAIVVVEDDFIVRMVTVAALTAKGFDVFDAQNADEAVAILEVDAGQLHVFFTDVQMPGSMNGIKLANHARRRWPWIVSLVTSGRLAPMVDELPAPRRLIPKPYNLVTIVTHIRELVRARR